MSEYEMLKEQFNIFNRCNAEIENQLRERQAAVDQAKVCKFI